MSDGPASTLALCAWLKKRIASWESDAKAELALETGERKAAKLSGTVVAYTNKVRGRRSVKITNEAMLQQYVRELHPDELETVVQIRPAFLAKVLEQVLKDGKLVDPMDVVWDCVEVVEGEPFLTTRLEPDASIVIAGLLQSGRIGVDGIRSIEAGDQ